MHSECKYTVKEADINLLVRESSRHLIERYLEVKYVNENYLIT